MRKAISLVLVLCFMGTSVFAVPVAAAISSQQPTTTIVSVNSSPLFADVNATALNDEEAAMVEGQGPILAWALAALLGAIGAYYGDIGGAQSMAGRGGDLQSPQGVLVMGGCGVCVGLTFAYVGYGLGMAIPLF